MKEGLLWYCDDGTKDLAAKVTAATRRYRRKFKAVPNVCFVHPSALDDGKAIEAGGVQVKPLVSVLRHHFWIGVNDDA